MDHKEIVRNSAPETAAMAGFDSCGFMTMDLPAGKFDGSFNPLTSDRVDYVYYLSADAMLEGPVEA